MEHDTEAILNTFNQHLRSHGQRILNASQQALLGWCLSHPRGNYREIAQATGYQSSSLRDAGSKLFALIESAVGRSVNKATCGPVLREWYEQKIAFERHHTFGRGGDLQALLEAIKARGRRLICISGPPRMGKTHLVGQLCQHLQTHEDFEVTVASHATHLPTVEALYQHVSTYLGERRPYPGQLSAATALTHILETRRLLLILEKTEVLYESDAMGGRFKPESACYEPWLGSLLDRHSLRSCVILVCRVPPRCLQSSHDKLSHHPLQGLTESAAEELLRQQGLAAHSAPQLQQLAGFCGYNPGVLVAAAHKILQSGTRSLEDFIRYPLVMFHADDPIWQAALDDLTPSEYDLLSWLLLYPDSLVKQDGNGLELNGRVSRALLPVMQSLANRGFVAANPRGEYFIQTQWLRHVAMHHGLKRLATAFMQEDSQVWGQYPLLVPHAPLGRRQWHRQHRLEPLGDQLDQANRHTWTTQYRQDKINTMLTAIRANPELQAGYGAGNLLNLAVALKVPLAGLNLTGLTIRQADLWTAQAHRLDLTDCDLIDTVLPLALYGTLTAALSPDGHLLAVGDATGRILCWRRLDQVFELYRFTQITGGNGLGITHLAFGDEDMLAVAAGQTVHRWWLGDAQTTPVKLMSVSAPVTSLTCCRDDYVAVGLQDGGIVVWDDSLEAQIELRRHMGPVQEVVANPGRDSHQLLSRGGGDRILVWNIREPGTEPREIRPERYIFFRMTWQSNQPVFAAYVGDQLLLRLSNGTTQNLPFKENIAMLRFSPNGQYLAALKRDSLNVRGLSTLTASTLIPHPGQLSTMAVSNQGNWLLTIGQDRPGTPTTVQVWDVSTRQLSWQLTATQPGRSGTGGPGEPPIPDIQLRNCQGLTAVEQAYWQSYGVTL